ncbi:MBG domain-containing protein [Fibrobacter sp.]|uniref:MBG domain-containing protein n=1 Tax=Fibrobacter sp. TaxID=35828 RepID=UPI0038706F35
MKNIKLTAILTILLLSAFVSTAWAQEDQCPALDSLDSYSKSDTFYEGCGSEISPYLIDSPAGLDTLSKRVNSGASSYEGVYFQLAADIEYSYTSTTENNYTAIGTEDNPFKGVFNGNGHSIRGIRINKPDDEHQGLFGKLGGEAAVENVRLANVEITGGSNTGGIAGENAGVVSGCTVDSIVIKSTMDYAVHLGGIAGYNAGSVSGCISSATITAGNYGDYFGGIVGYNEGSVSGCTSSATIAGRADDCGGVVGYNGKNGSISENLAIGATIPQATFSGVIGTGGGSWSNNYYMACTYNGVENSTNVGTNNGDITYNNSAVSIHTVTLEDGISIASPEKPAYIDKDQNKYYAAGSEITLSSTQPGENGFSFTANGVRIPSKFKMIAENIKVSVIYGDYWGIEGGADGSEGKPYIISTVDDLKTLAMFINVGENYDGKYFNLGADIEFTREKWDAASSSTENNFSAIGTEDNPFKGIFNGKGHTIRGIRIYKPGLHNHGLFGALGEGAVVDSTKLADVIITGYANVGGIAGYNSHGEIRNCTVDSVLLKGVMGNLGGIVGYNVYGTVSGCTSSATLVSTDKDNHCYGGIVGNNYYGTISGCMSSATLVCEDKECTDYGGIAGYNHGNLNDNAVIGATIPAVKYSGAVVGQNYNGSLLNNYYATCTVAGVENATDVGVGNVGFEASPHDVTDGNGAISVSVTAPTAVENLVYDGSSHNLVTGGETNYGTMYYSLDGKAYSAEIPAVSGANAYTVYYKVMKEEKWTVFDVQTLEVSIAKASLTVTVNADTITYGDQTPIEFDYTIEGLIDGDQLNDVTTSCGDDAISEFLAVGKYDISVSVKASSNPNYNVTEVGNKLTVQKKLITVTGVTAKNRDYNGEKNVDLDGSKMTMEGYVENSDVSVDLSDATGTMEDANVGKDKAVTVTGIKLSGADAGNYVVKYPQSLIVTITQATPTVTAPAPIANLVYTGSAQPLVTAGETDFGTLLYSLDDKDYSAEIPATSDASTYTVYYKVAEGDNWNGIDAKKVEVSIAQVPLTVTAKDKSIVYGDDPANDGVEYSGFIGDETASVLGGKLTYSYDYKKLDNVGKYTITPSGLTASNYEITFVPGTLKVGKADVSVTAPVAKENLVYSGKSQELVSAGSTDYGTLLYSLDGKDYSDKIPVATDAKTYTVYYKVAGSDNWNAFDAKKVEVKIAESKHSTAIGRVDARTGEFKMLRNYDLKGRNVQGKVKAPGAYYGKKVLNK